MSKLDAFLASYKPPTRGTADAIAKSLEAEGEKAGFGPRIDVDKPTVVYLYDSPDEAVIAAMTDEEYDDYNERIVCVLVSRGSQKQLRNDVRAVLGGTPISPEYVLIAGDDVPPDVRRFFGNEPLGLVTRRLHKDGYVTHALDLGNDDHVAEACEKAAERFEEAFGEKLHPNGGTAVFEAMDRIVMRIRPEGLGAEAKVDKDAVVPTRVIEALSLLACEAGRRLERTGSFLVFDGDASEDTTRLPERHEPLGIELANGGVVDFGSVIRARWAEGSENSVVEEWTVAKELDGDPEIQSMAESLAESLAEETDEDAPRGGIIETPEDLADGIIAVYVLMGHAENGLDEGHLSMAYILPFSTLQNVLLKFVLLKGGEPATIAQKLLSDRVKVELSVNRLGKWLRARGDDGENAIDDLLDIARSSVVARGKPAIFGLFGRLKPRDDDAAKLKSIEWLLRTDV